MPFPMKLHKNVFNFNLCILRVSLEYLEEFFFSAIIREIFHFDDRSQNNFEYFVFQGFQLFRA